MSWLLLVRAIFLKMAFAYACTAPCIDFTMCFVAFFLALKAPAIQKIWTKECFTTGISPPSQPSFKVIFFVFGVMTMAGCSILTVLLVFTRG